MCDLTAAATLGELACEVTRALRDWLAAPTHPPPHRAAEAFERKETTRA